MNANKLYQDAHGIHLHIVAHANILLMFFHPYSCILAGSCNLAMLVPYHGTTSPSSIGQNELFNSQWATSASFIIYITGHLATHMAR